MEWIGIPFRPGCLRAAGKGWSDPLIGDHSIVNGRGGGLQVNLADRLFVFGDIRRVRAGRLRLGKGLFLGSIGV